MNIASQIPSVRRASRVLMGALMTVFALSAAPVSAQTGGQDTVVILDVLPGWTTDRGTRIAALRLRLAPGWKTYWRAPGDAGIPPRLRLAGSANIAAIALNWPVPVVFDTAGMRSVGYHDSVVVPVEITPRGAGDVRLAGTLDIGVCADVCMPAQLTFDAALPDGGTRDDRIVAALADRPLTSAEAGVGSVHCVVTPTERGIGIVIQAQMPALGAVEEVVIEAGDAEVWVSEPQIVRQGGTLQATAQMIHVEGGGFVLDRSAVRITVLAGGQAVDIRGCTPD